MIATLVAIWIVAVVLLLAGIDRFLKRQDEIQQQFDDEQLQVKDKDD